MSLNILFATSTKFYGGGEIWILSVIKELSSRGYNVKLICPAESVINNKAAEKNIKVIPFKFSGDFDPFTIFKIYRLLKKHKIDIIITNMHKEQRLFGAASRLIKHVKLIAVRHVDIPIKNNFYYRLTYGVLADCIVTNSIATKNTLLSHAPWLKQNNVRVIYHGIDIRPYESAAQTIRGEINVPDDTPLIGFAGRLNIQKGIVYMMDAFKIIKEKIPGVQLLIAGTGDLENEIINKAGKYGFRNSIHLVGFREDIPVIMNSIDLLILPSLWEGFGLVLIEAMAAGKACVTTDISSMPEIVAHNISGIIVPPKDSGALAEACIRLLNNKSLRIKMGMEGKRIVKEKFQLDVMIDNYEKLFYELLGTNIHHHL